MFLLLQNIRALLNWETKELFESNNNTINDNHESHWLWLLPMDLLTLLGPKPRSNRPILGPKSLLMGMSKSDGTGFCRGWSRLMMLLARARVASVLPLAARGRRLGMPPPGPPPCHGDTPARPKFFPRSFRPKSMRRPLFWGLRLAILFIDLEEVCLTIPIAICDHCEPQLF